MEDIGRLVSRYYVIKTDGIFSKNPRFLNIHEQGLEFRNLNYAKAGKGAELCLFRDLTEVLLSDRNEKDLVIKTGKQSCTLACGDRTNLLTDLLLYKVSSPRVTTSRRICGTSRTTPLPRQRFLALRGTDRSTWRTRARKSQ